jgi:PPM family protein phosphatase
VRLWTTSSGSTLTAGIQLSHIWSRDVDVIVGVISEERVVTGSGRVVQGWSPVSSRAPGDLVLDPALVSISGPRRANEDAGFAGPHVVAVADGVGGNVGGEVAARLAVEAVSADLGDVAAGVARANGQLGAAVATEPRLAGMATTLTAAELVGHQLVVAHVGDSRAYLLHDGVLHQLTHDQTFVQSLVDAGVISAEQARRHPLRSVILAALRGTDEDLAHLQMTSRAVEPGDRVLICSDGLSGVVKAEMLAKVLEEERLPAEAATRLVRAALAAGTHDNVTAVVADVRLTAPAQAHVSSGTPGSQTVAA